MQNLGDLTNDELLARLSVHVGRGHVWQARLLEYLGEVEVRRLDREYAYSSMWDFCIRKLGMSEGEAYRRIAVARVVRQFPRALALLERGKVHLSAVYTLCDHLSEENHEELLREAIGKTTQEIRAMIAARFPRPDVASCIEPVAPQAQLPIGPPHASQGFAPSAAGSVGTEMRPTIEPLSPTRYRVELTVSVEIKAKLERIKDLMRHRNPAGDLEIVLDASLDLLLAKLERERLGKTSRARRAKCAEPNTTAAEHDAGGSAITDAVAASPAGRGSVDCADAEATTNAAVAAAHGARAKQGGDDAPKMGRRHIPREVRREVFARDGEQCSYVDAEGNRCPARALLELDHVHPKALGGTDDAANLRVRCRAHNQHHAEQVFGRQHVASRIHLRQLKYASRSSARLETVAQALRSLGFREPEVRRVMPTLETRFGEDAPLETMIREALLLLT